MDKKVEEKIKLKDNRISRLVREAGMIYFEYDPVSHIAARPGNVIADGMPDILENYPECVIERTIKDPLQADIFRRAFRAMDEGSSHEAFEVEIHMNDGVYWFSYRLVKSQADRKVVCIASDVTDRHMHNALEKLILQEQFESICLIDTLEGTFHSIYMKQGNFPEAEVQYNYAEGCRQSAQLFVEKTEHGVFMEKASIATIQSKLATEKKYSFIVNGFDKYGNKQLHQYSYQYLDQRRCMVLATLEDVTRITDHDVLTGEFNRNGFNRYVADYLEHCEDRTRYAILFFDIKGFKAINELLGLEGGDAVLKETAIALRDSFLQPIAISRLEADHFAVFIDQCNLDFEQISRQCSSRTTVNGKSIHYYGRCGVYPLNEHHHHVSGMCDRARLANEYIEDDYVKPYAIYNDEMRKRFMKNRELLNELEHGIKNEEFEVYYQPIYDADSEEIISAEALVRWIHPEYGMIPPGDFITTFEETGHISQLDALVENQVKDFIVERVRSGKKMIPVAINLSRMDFYDISFMEKILWDIREIRELDQFCRLEITESAYSALIDNAENYIKAFKEAGVKILLDDFGSGYSSFSTIREFDFDILKLDIGFIQMIGKSEKVEGIIQSIITMAKLLKLKVVAEGVETREQKEFLQKWSCDYFQGYLYSKPLPKEEFTSLLDQNL